jgi:hypothetical protein
MMNPRMDAPVKTGFHSRNTKVLPVMFLEWPGAERRFSTKGGQQTRKASGEQREMKYIP